MTKNDKIQIELTLKDAVFIDCCLEVFQKAAMRRPANLYKEVANKTAEIRKKFQLHEDQESN